MESDIRYLQKEQKMGLNKSKGNMYPWITDTWNTIKGACPHDCSYCYMKRWGKLNPVRLDESEFKTNLGEDEYAFIFVGSSCDMFAKDIPDKWIKKTLDYCKQFDVRYLFQTKNPSRIIKDWLPKHSVICTTIETNRWYPEIMNNSPPPYIRAPAIGKLCMETYVTIEPILDFDLWQMVDLIKFISPVQVNIGADSGNNKLPEPGSDKINILIKKLEIFTTVKLKVNLKRLL